MKKGKCIKIPLLTNQNGNLFHTSVFSRVFYCSYYQEVNAATVKFRKCGIEPVSSLDLNVNQTFLSLRVDHQLRARRVIAICKYVPLRTRRALSMFKDSALLVLNGTLLMPFWLSGDDVFLNPLKTIWFCYNTHFPLTSAWVYSGLASTC